MLSPYGARILMAPFIDFEEREFGVELVFRADIEAHELSVTAQDPCTGVQCTEVLFTSEELKDGDTQKVKDQYRERIAAIAAKVKRGSN